jgi:DNA-binding IclR family transcriptional regulator
MTTDTVCPAEGSGGANLRPTSRRPAGMADDRTVVGRIIAILDCVVDAVAPLPLAVLTRRTGIPKPTARRIANDLVQRGMLDHTVDGYIPGQRIMHQGLVSAHHHGGTLTVQPYLQDLHLCTQGEMAWVATLCEGQLTVTGAAFGRHHVAGMRLPWFPRASRIGPSMVLLAVGRIEVAHNRELADRILRSGWAPMTRYSVIDKRRMRSLLDEARDTGFVHEAEQAVMGASCMAAALRDSSGQFVGAIGVAGRCRAIEGRGVRARLLRSAELLQQDLRSASRTPALDARPLPIMKRRRGIAHSLPRVHGPGSDEPLAPIKPTG